MRDSQFNQLFDYIEKIISLSDSEKVLLKSKLLYKQYLKNQFLVQQGDPCKFESFVVSGCLKTFHIDKDGIEHVIGFAVENWWAADLGSFLTGEESFYNVQCLEKTEVIQFSHTMLEELYEEIPKLERFFRVICQKAYVASQKRIVDSFSLTAKERYEMFRKQYPEIEQKVPQYLIASYLGITKEFLSKIRNQY